MGPYSCLSYTDRMCLQSYRDLCMVFLVILKLFCICKISLCTTRTKLLVIERRKLLVKSWRKRHAFEDQLEENGLKHWKHLVLLFYLVKNIPLLVSSTRFMIVINARYIFLAPMSQLEIFFFFALLLEKAPQVAPSSGNGH